MSGKIYGRPIATPIRPEKIAEKIAGEGYSEVIAQEQELTFSEVNGKQCSTNLLLAEPLKVGSTYKVVWGDKEFICRCYDEASGGGMSHSGTLLGNASLLLDI